MGLTSARLLSFLLLLRRFLQSSYSTLKKPLSDTSEEVYRFWRIMKQLSRGVAQTNIYNDDRRITISLLFEVFNMDDE